MIVATIHRNENNGTWVVLIRDTIRETKSSQVVDTLAEAEAVAERAGSKRVKVMLGG